MNCERIYLGYKLHTKAATYFYRPHFETDGGRNLSVARDERSTADARNIYQRLQLSNVYGASQNDQKICDRTDSATIKHGDAREFPYVILGALSHAPSASCSDRKRNYIPFWA